MAAQRWAMGKNCAYGMQSNTSQFRVMEGLRFTNVPLQRGVFNKQLPARHTTRSTGLRRVARAGLTAAATSEMASYTLYTGGTPNGWKANIILEELGVDYKVHAIDISTNVQKEDWFLKINPNGRIPALVDHENGDLPVFESGAIMWYLVMKHDSEGKFWPKDFNQRATVMSWLMFQMGGVGPMQGQANHFVRYAKERLEYPTKRYTEETERLYSVLESQLTKTEYLAGDQYTIADMANWCWVVLAPYSGVDVKKFPKLSEWTQKIYQRPAAKKAISIPKESPLASSLDSDEAYNKMLEESNQRIKESQSTK